jgi:DNA-binding transcriptional MerR regulator
MAWSTRQLAHIVGVSSRTIRHWHDVGLLPEPDRLSNNYKQYGPEHLILALRIHRLAGLGFGLDRIRAMLADADLARASLADLHDELDASIARLQQTRDEVDRLLETGNAPDLTSEAVALAAALGTSVDPSDAAMASSEFAVVFDHVTTPGSAARLQNVLAHAPSGLRDLEATIAALPADASQDQIDALVAHGLAVIGPFLQEHSDELDGFDALPAGSTKAEALMATATDSLNPAQQQVVEKVIARLPSVSGTSSSVQG